MPVFSKHMLCSGLLATLAGCAATDGTTLSSPSKPEAQVELNVTYRDARDDLFPTARGAHSGPVLLKEDVGGKHIHGPYLSIARKCDAAHTVCKLAVIKLQLTYTVSKSGPDWVLEGDLSSTISRSETASISGMTLTKTLPTDVSLIDDESTQPRHFHWVVRPGSRLELQGPAGAEFILEQRQAS